jgi:hypothetical protein
MYDPTQAPPEEPMQLKPPTQQRSQIEVVASDPMQAMKF